jgi:hypothetical protein
MSPQSNVRRYYVNPPADPQRDSHATHTAALLGGHVAQPDGVPEACATDAPRLQVVHLPSGDSQLIAYGLFAIDLTPAEREELRQALVSPFAKHEG